MKVGDKIKTFEIKQIVKGYKGLFTNSGKKTKVLTHYYLLKSENGQERVLESGKTNLNQCEQTYSHITGKFKYMVWNQLEIIK